MNKSAAALVVSEVDIAAGRVLVAFDAAGRTIGVACVMPEGETADLDVMFVDPPAIGSGAGRVLFEAAVVLARRLGSWRMTILVVGSVPSARKVRESWSGPVTSTDIRSGSGQNSSRCKTRGVADHGRNPVHAQRSPLSTRKARPDVASYITARVNDWID